MQPKALKQAIAHDLETLKHLDLDILPAQFYYPAVFLGYLLIFVLFLGIQSAIAFVGVHKQIWPYVSERTQHDLDSERESKINDMSFSKDFQFDGEFELQREFPQASREEIKQMVAQKQQVLTDAAQKKLAELDQKIDRERELEHRNRVNEMAWGIVLSSLGFMVFWIGAVKNYVIFRAQLRNRLQSGRYLDRMIKIAFVLFFALFAFFSCFSMLLMDQNMTLYAGIPALILAAFIIGALIQMESSRVGVSVISTAVGQFFENRDKPLNNNP